MIIKKMNDNMYMYNSTKKPNLSVTAGMQLNSTKQSMTT